MFEEIRGVVECQFRCRVSGHSLHSCDDRTERGSHARRRVSKSVRCHSGGGDAPEASVAQTCCMLSSVLQARSARTCPPRFGPASGHVKPHPTLPRRRVGFFSSFRWRCCPANRRGAAGSARTSTAEDPRLEKRESRVSRSARAGCRVSPTVGGCSHRQALVLRGIESQRNRVPKVSVGD